MTRIAIVIGSTRPGRRAAAVAHWVHDVARRHPRAAGGDVEFELVDLAEFDLPLLDEAVPGIFGRYAHEHTRRWSDTVAAFDGFVFVTPEYNHSAPASLKNAIDFLFAEWNDKAVGFVSYGIHSGVRAVEHLRLTMAEVGAADVRTQVALSLFTEFEITDPTNPDEAVVFTPGGHQEPTLVTLLDEVLAWSQALAPLRRSRTSTDAASGDLGSNHPAEAARA